MSSYQHPNLLALDQVEDILEAYAAARLTPRRPVLARIRAAVVSEAASMAATRAVEQRDAVAGAAALRAAGPRARFSLPRLTLASFARPAFALGFAGLLAITSGTAIATASPDSPLFMARVALQDMFLPVEIDARFASHEQYLNEYLAEAEDAAARGDDVGFEAALAAYQDEVDQTLSDIGNDYGRLAHFQAVLESHVAKLTALSLSLPTEVARGNAEEHAVQASENAVTKAANAVTRVKEQKAHADNKPPSPPGQQNGPGPADDAPGQSNVPNRPSNPSGQSVNPEGRTP
jgi:hypothetical protein